MTNRATDEQIKVLEEMRDWLATEFALWGIPKAYKAKCFDRHAALTAVLDYVRDTREMLEAATEIR